MSRRETLGIYIYASPKNERERQFNASMEEKAEAIRCRRFEQLLNEQFDFLDKEKLRMDFLAYFKQKCRQKYQKWDCVLRHFTIYCKGKCTFCGWKHFRSYISEVFSSNPDDATLDWNSVGACIHYLGEDRTI